MTKQNILNKHILNSVINGDFFDEVHKVSDNSIDLIFVDPPYWMRTEDTLLRPDGSVFSGCDDDWDKFNSLTAYEEFTKNWLIECMRILKDNGCIWVIGGMQCIYIIGHIMQKLGFWIINDIVWYKNNPTPNFHGTRLCNSHETLLWAVKNKTSRYTFNYKTAKELNLDNISSVDYNKGFRKQMTSIWRFPICSGKERLLDDNGNKLHNTQKPLNMIKRIVAISSNIGDTVFDPFSGTMTTAVAAKSLGRNYIVIEKNEKYCKHGMQRLIDTNVDTNSVISTAILDKKPPRITFKKLVEYGLFKVGEWFYTKDGTPIAQLLQNAKLQYDSEEIDIHTCVSKIKKGVSKLNGFDYWYVLRNGLLVSINDIRRQYLNYISE